MFKFTADVERGQLNLVRRDDIVNTRLSVGGPRQSH